MKLIIIVIINISSIITLGQDIVKVLPAGGKYFPHSGVDWDHAYSLLEVPWSDYSNANNYPYSVHVTLGSGTYNLSSAININGSGINETYPLTIRKSIESGYNGNVVIRQFTQDIKIQNIFNLVNVNYVKIENISFGYVTAPDNDTNDINPPSPAQIKVYDCSFITINNCLFNAGILDNNNEYWERFLRNIWFDKVKNSIISNCNIKVSGLRGIQLDKTNSLIIEYNTVTTDNGYNMHQIDCIQIGGLGNYADIGYQSEDEKVVIRFNSLINSSNYEKGHDDCIQIYTDIQDNGITQGKKYCGGRSYENEYDVFQIVEIYRNWIEQTNINDDKNTGIIIGGADHDEIGDPSYPLPLNYKEGLYTKWRIWSNIIRVKNAKGLISFGNVRPAEILIYNNTLYAEANTSSALIIYYNRWNNVVYNTIIKNNIFRAGSNTNDKIPMVFGYFHDINENGNIDLGDYQAPVLDFDCNGYDSQSSVFIDYNCYWGGSTNENIVTRYYNNNGNWYNENYTIAQWRNSLDPITTFDINGNRENPKFITYPNEPGLNSNDYLLFKSKNSDSWCIDNGFEMFTGSNNYTKDFIGTNRPSGTGYWDIGAFEQGATTPWSPPIDGLIISENGTLDAYPSPFNPSSTIYFSINTDGLVILKVFDLLGKEVQTLVNEFKKAGKYSVVFDGKYLASGTYIYFLQSPKYTNIKKIVLLK
ncbi:MAG TPA: hypothetical protein VFF33_11900 [Ignavibacteriaceae bacterium]|nr:hypothetical protein [Ignavibacteriaceae bacterium]